MKRVNCLICIFFVLTILVVCPAFISEAFESDDSISESINIEISSYDLYIYDKNEVSFLNFENYLKSENINYDKNVKAGNNAVCMYSFKSIELDKAYIIFCRAKGFFNDSADVVNMTARGSVNELYENKTVAKAIYNKLNFLQKNILQSDTFYESDGVSQINGISQNMQIVVRKSTDFNEFIIGIPSVLNEY